MSNDVLTDEPRAWYPAMAAARGRVEPAPRRVRGMAGAAVIFDTARAKYVWEEPYYPQYYVPRADVDPTALVDEGTSVRSRLGAARSYGLQSNGHVRAGAARVYGVGAASGLAEHVRFDWSALDSWWEEDEEIFVHPRNPFVRVDALRSRRRVRIERDGEVLAESHSPVLVFETGLPTRYYVDRSDVRWERLVLSSTRSACPYKGRTTDFWSVRTAKGFHEDLAWSYQFPLAAASAIAGLVAFFNERVDVAVDGVPQPRPSTHLA